MGREINQIYVPHNKKGRNILISIPYLWGQIYGCYGGSRGGGFLQWYQHISIFLVFHSFFWAEFLYIIAIKDRKSTGLYKLRLKMRKMNNLSTVSFLKNPRGYPSWVWTISRGSDGQITAKSEPALFLGLP